MQTRALCAAEASRPSAGIKDGCPAAITAIQVYGGALNLNVHFHVITPDALFSPRASSSRWRTGRPKPASLLREDAVLARKTRPAGA
ncbi:MAG: transposase [Deltaproteobacteria bacterium]|nr:transposase [Deltaproteobacteria bacterium]